MVEITASLVKELREKPGAGMMDCKKALTETDGALEDAVDWLRKNGRAAAAKKAGRIAAEGLVAVATLGGRGTIVEINACPLYTSPRPRDATLSRMPSSA